MDRESLHNTHEPELGDKEVLHDIEQARQALASLWHRETNLPELQKRLRLQDQQYQQDLIARGYEMTALLRMGKKEGLPERRDIHQLLIVSGSATKREAVEEAVEGMQIDVSGIAEGSLDEEEQKSHASLRKMMQENEDRRRGREAIPSIRTYTPDFYTVDVAEDKARAVAGTHPRNALFASDVVALNGADILEKTKSADEARAVLAQISGKEIRVSSGSVLIATIPSGETILTREGVVMHIMLREFSPEDVDRYLREREGYQSVAGVIDYAHPAAQRLIAQKPIRIEKLAIEGGEPFGGEAYIDPTLLPHMRDYCIGMPKEMIREMVRRTEGV